MAHYMERAERPAPNNGANCEPSAAKHYMERRTTVRAVSSAPHDTMDQDVAKELRGMKLLVFREMLEAVGFPRARALVDQRARGTVCATFVMACDVIFFILLIGGRSDPEPPAAG